MRWAILILAAAGCAQAQHAAAVFVGGASAQVVAGDTMQLTAAAYDSNGAPIPSAQITWSVSDKTAFSIDSKGVVQAITLGWADVYADTTGARGTLRLQVVPLAINVHPDTPAAHVGDSVQFTADVLDVNSQPLSGVALQWRAYGPNSSPNNGVSVTQAGLVSALGFGNYFIEAYFNYTVGSGPFLQRVFGNTLLTVQGPNSYRQTKLMDSVPVRQTFELRQRRGSMSVNDSGEIAYVGWLEGFAPAALLWSGGAFSPVAVGGVPLDLPGMDLMDFSDLSINNNGEVATNCVLAPYRSCILFGNQAGSHVILLDGSAGNLAANIRNYQTTRFSLNDGPQILFRGDYQNPGSTTTLTGLFTSRSNGLASLAAPAATNLPGIGTTYTFDRDFGLDNNGAILFFATNGSARALYRMTPDAVISRVIGTGDIISGSPVVSLSNVAVGKNGQFATMVNTGSFSYALLYGGDPSKYSQVRLDWYQNVFAVSGAGEAVFTASINGQFGLYRWDGSTAKAVLLTGEPSPSGDLYTQIDSAGITAKGEVLAQTRTANNILLVVNAGDGPGATPSAVFQPGVPVGVPAGPAFSSIVLNSHTGNPMVKTGMNFTEVFEYADGSLLPRLISGDRTPDGWFYEGNLDVRRNGDGDLFVPTDQSLTQIGANGSTLLCHFPQRITGGLAYSGFQVAANTTGTVAVVGGTNFGPQHLSLISQGSVNAIAYLGGSGAYRTASPGGGYFQNSNDIAVDDNGTVYASLRVNGGPDGLFAYSAGAWSAVLKIGDPFDGRNVSAISNLRAAGNTCYAVVQTTGGLSHLSRYQNGAWSDIVSYGDNVPTVPSGGYVNYIGAFDVNRNGQIAVVLNAIGGQFVTYINGTDWRLAADNLHVVTSSGELLMNFFQVSLNDDGRIFAQAMNDQDVLVLYEFDPAS